MCAILDANVVGQVFGGDRPPAGKAFFDWIDSGRGRLAIGGRLRRELDRNRAFRAWRVQAALAGRITMLKDEVVDSKADELDRQNACRSDDPHVVAAAQVSGARLLYTNDGDLQADFRDKTLIDRPRGRVYSTRERKYMTRGHRALLANRRLCARDRR